MNVAELRAKSKDELITELQALQREQVNLRMQKGISEVLKPHNFKRVRRDIARVKTILNSKERGNDN